MENAWTSSWLISNGETNRFIDTWTQVEGGLDTEMKLNQHLCEESGNIGGMDDQETGRKPAKTLSLIQRLDRLDQLMLILEEKHGMSSKRPDDLVVRKEDPRDECKSISSALNEAHHKGTLVERLTMLEDRVQQLSLEIDASNTSKSTSSCVLSNERTGNNKSDPSASVFDEDRKNARTIAPENTDTSPLKAQEMGRACMPKRRREAMRSPLRRSEWLGCFRSRMPTT